MPATHTRTARVPARRSDDTFDYDWLVIGSGFGGSVSAMRLVEKGYRVAVVERGKRWADADLPATTEDRQRFLWAPALGWRGIMRGTLFRNVFSSTQTGVGGGSLVYGGVLFRPQQPFYEDEQWRDLGRWEEELAPHYQKAESMLGARTTPWESTQMDLMRETAAHFGPNASFSKAPTGVFFGEPGKTVPDPYFGGEGPSRTGCIRCGECMVGCRVGAANTLTKNYLWFAEKGCAQILAERQVVDVTPLGAADGSDGYRVVAERTDTRGPRGREVYTTRGVVFAGGAVGTNELMADCKHRGSLPRISDRLGTLVRTNSETVLSVLLPEDRGAWKDVTASSRVIIDDTQVEFLTYGPHANFMRLLFTPLAGHPAHRGRLRAWARTVLRHPLRSLATMRSKDWSRRTVMMLVMQPRDNAIRFRPVKRRLGRGYRLVSETDPQRPAPVYLETGHKVAQWLADRTGGTPESSVFEVFGDRTFTAHVLGGAAIGADADSGVIDSRMHVFGYRNMLVCDAAALPANPGVNPALTIAAMSEYAMTGIPAAHTPA